MTKEIKWMKIGPCTEKGFVGLIRGMLSEQHICMVNCSDFSRENMEDTERILSENGVVHCYDMWHDSFMCFRNEEEMKSTYDKIIKG